MAVINSVGKAVTECVIKTQFFLALGIRCDGHSQVLAAFHSLVFYGYGSTLLHLPVHLGIFVHYKVHSLVVRTSNFQGERMPAVPDIGYLTGNRFSRFLFLLVGSVRLRLSLH